MVQQGSYVNIEENFRILLTLSTLLRVLMCERGETKMRFRKHV